MAKDWQEKRLGPQGWTRAIAEAEWAEAGPGILFEEGEYTAEEIRGWSKAERKGAEAEWAYQAGKGSSIQPGLAIDIKVSGAEALARNFETLSDRAHKQLIPAVLKGSVNRLNNAIVKNIPVGPRGHRGDTGGWRKAQSQTHAESVAGGGRHTTTFAAPLPTEAALGIRSGESYYPFNVEYGSRFAAALAPIRRAVERLEKSEIGEILDLLGHGLGALAIPMGVGLLLRKVIYGRATPKEFMPIEWSRSRPGDSL